jgi:hypothetical protein
MKRTVLLVATLVVAPAAFADRWVQVGTFETGTYAGVVAHLDTATVTNNAVRDGSFVVTVRYTRPDGQPFSVTGDHKQFSQIKETYRVFCQAHRFEDAWTKLFYADGQSEEAGHWDSSRAQISQAAILDNVLQLVCKVPNAVAVAKVMQ